MKRSDSLLRLTLKTQLILPWRGFVIPANCIRAGEFKQTPSSPGTFVKRPRRLSSSCTKVSPRSVKKGCVSAPPLEASGRAFE